MELWHAKSNLVSSFLHRIVRSTNSGSNRLKLARKEISESSSCCEEKDSPAEYESVHLLLQNLRSIGQEETNQSIAELNMTAHDRNNLVLHEYTLGVNGTKVVACMGGKTKLDIFLRHIVETQRKSNVSISSTLENSLCNMLDDKSLGMLHYMKVNLQGFW